MRGSLADYDTLASRLSAVEWSEPDSLERDGLVVALAEIALRCGWMPCHGVSVVTWSRNRLRTLRGNSDPSFSWERAA